MTKLIGILMLNLIVMSLAEVGEENKTICLEKDGKIKKLPLSFISQKNSNRHNSRRRFISRMMMKICVKELYGESFFARCESSAYLEKVEHSASIPLTQYGVWGNYSEWQQLEFK